MNNNTTSIVTVIKRNNFLSGNHFTFLILMGIIFLSSGCGGTDDATSFIYGKYKWYSEDPSVKRFIIYEDNYLKINEDQTIVYHTTINSKPKFNIEGEFTLDKETTTLNIKWKEGKLPAKLTIEKKGEDYIIKVGETIYKKERQ